MGRIYFPFILHILPRVLRAILLILLILEKEIRIGHGHDEERIIHYPSQNQQLIPF
jgi:hypothetical protein